MKKNNTFKKIWNGVTTGLVALVVLCAIFLMGSRLLGYRVFNVISGSMAPKYNVGDLIYVKAVDPMTIKVGDAITFVANENLVVATHQVVEINLEKQYFITQGLTNDTLDPPVHFNNVIGVPQFSIPLLGYVSNFIQNPPGLYITVGLGIILVGIVFLPDLIMTKKTEEKKEDIPEEAISENEENN